MAVAGSLTYDTDIDKTGFNKGLNSITDSVKSGGTKIKNIVSALGITKIVSTAINTINNSIDGAVSRIDTLNNFPKVMANLGIASEDSSKAINKLSDGLQGIPTTLDAASLSVQRFTSVNGDVDKSTEYFLALNNAILAGGASSEIQSSAIEQLSQSYSKGKMDMMEWRTIQMAMPAQLKQVAEAMNMTTDELGEGLRYGTIEMDSFMDTIVKLNKEGTEQYLSFAEQAKNATGGIKTSFTNAKTAITRGVANVVDTIDKALKKTDLGGIGPVISKIGSISEKALKKVADWISKIDFNKILNTMKQLSNVYGPKIKKVLETVVDVFKNIWSWAMKNKAVIESIVGVVLSLVAAMKVYQGVMTVIKGIDMAKNIISALNPTTALISLTLGLAAAAVSVATAVANEKKSLDGVADSAKLQQESWESLKKAREDSLSSSETEIGTLQALANELKKITDENGQVKSGYENRAKYILGELNTALGTEYTMNGNIISQYGELKDNIDQLIEKKKVEATLDAYKEEYQTALTQQKDATKTLVELRQKYNEELAKTPQNFADEQEKLQNLNYIGQQIKEQTDLIGEYGYTIQNYEKLTSASVSNNKEVIEKALDEMGISYDEAKTKVNTSLTEQIQSQTNYVSLLKQSWQDAKNSNDTFQAEILQKQLDTEEQALTNLALSLAQQTSTVTELTEEQKTAWKNLADTSCNAYEQGLSNVPEETRLKIQEATGVVTTAGINLTSASGTLAKDVLFSYSSKLNLAGATGQQISEASEILKSDNSVGEGAAEIASDVNTNLNNNINGKKWGADLTTNISEGMVSPEVRSKIVEAAKNVANSIKEFLGHSVPKSGPLKDELTYMPDMINNLVEGINKNRYKVSDATKKIAEDMKNSFDLSELNKNIISKMNKAVAIETGSINATASVKSNNSILNVINLTAKIDGSVEMNNQKLGRLVAPEVCKTIKAGGLR